MKLCVVQPPYFQNRIVLFSLPIPTLCERFIYVFSRTGLFILLQPVMWTDPGNI